MNEPLTGIVEAIVYFTVAFSSVFVMIYVVAKLDQLWIRKKPKLDQLVCWIRRKMK